MVFLLHSHLISFTVSESHFGIKFINVCIQNEFVGDKMSKQQEKLSVRLDLEDEMLEKFNFLRRKLGIFTATDLVRYLIVKAYNEMKSKKSQ